MDKPPPPPSHPAPAPAELLAPSWQMLQKSTAATAMADLAGRLTYVNPAWLALWGHAAIADVVGRTLTDIVSAPAGSEGLLQLLHQTGSWQGRIDARHADGSALPLACTLHLLQGADGQPLAMMGSFLDLRPELAALGALDAQRRFTEAVIGSAGVLVLVLDAAGRFVRFNAECERASGWRAGEILGRCPRDTVLPPDSAAHVRDEAFTSAIASGVPGTTTHHTNEWLARDGRRRLIEWTNTLITQGDGLFMVCIGVDVSQRRAAELSLRRAQQVAQLGTWDLDLGSGQLHWSDEIFRLFELDPATSTPTYDRFLSVVHPDDRELVDQAYRRSLSVREPYRIEHRLQMADGRIRWVEERCTSDFDRHGQALRSLGTVQDVTEQHERKRELARFRHLVEQASQEIWLFETAELRVVYLNRAAAESLGHARADLLGCRLADIDAGGAAAVDGIRQRIIQQAVRSVDTMTFEVVHRARDGRLVPKEIQATHLSIDGVVYGCAFAHDISERRRIQSALEDREMLLRGALETYPGGVAVVDEDLRYRYVNPQFAQALGLAPGDVIGHTVDQIRGPALAAELQAVNRRLRAGEQVELERPYALPGGGTRTFWVRYRMAADPAAPERSLYYAFGTDLTDLRHARERLQAVIDATRIGTWEWTSQTAAWRFDDKLYALVGHAATDLPLPTVERLAARVPPEDRVARQAAFDDVLAGRSRTVECEYRARHQHGHWVWLLDRGRVVDVDAEGRPLRVLGVTQDITTLKQQELDLQQLNADLERRVAERTRDLAAAKAEAERASQAKTEFLSQMSHELRTPLNAIIGFGQLLELSDLPPEEAGHVQEVMQAGRHLLNLINEVLDLSTVEAGRVDLSSEPVSLPDLVDECVALLRPAVQQAELGIESRVKASCAAVLADRGRLKQVLLNLLSNAVKYNRPGGRIVIDCHCGDGWCELAVSDTGAGLDATQVARLFQPFERLGAARSGIQGTGIGLSVSKRLVDLMGGQIGASSQPGQGSRFWLRLKAIAHPVASMAGSAPARPSAAATVDARQRRLLHVEDNLANQRLMQRILSRRSDLALLSTGDPREVVPLALQHRPELVLMDIQLPHLDGYQLLALLRAAGVDVPVLAISANATPDDVARGLAAGFSGYLTKPLQVAQLLACIDDLLPPTPAADAA